MFPSLQGFNKFALDTETTGLNPRRDKIFGVSVSTPDGKDYYWDIRRTPNVLEWLNDQLKFFNGIVIGHNFKYDVHFLRKHNVSMFDRKRANFI